MRVLTPRPLEAEIFRPFGEVVEAGGLPGLSVNEGRGRRIDMAAELQHGPAACLPALALYDMEASPWPVRLGVMERHRHSEQMFLFLAGETFLVAVAQPAADGNPDLATVQAFTGAPGQGIIYTQGIWHLPMVALRQAGLFAMMMWETGTAADCDTLQIAPSLYVQPAAT